MEMMKTAKRTEWKVKDCSLSQVIMVESFVIVNI